MRVLFVSSGNKNGRPSILVQNQADSLKKLGIDIEFFTINQKRIWGYLKYIFILKKYLKWNKFDIIHAHYSLSAFIATLAGCKPLVVSLMGSDTKLAAWNKKLVEFFSKNYWSASIVKSEVMCNDFPLSRLQVIPNGVDLEKVKSTPKVDSDTMIILFAADPTRESKNFQLAKEACALLNDTNHSFKIVYNISHSEIIKEINNANLLLLTSKWEGSPNIVKEAMACNCPVVATKVGDIEWLFDDEPGYYITSFKSRDVADKIQKALKFVKDYKHTKGRDRILKLGLDSESIAKRIISIYESVLSNE